MHASYNNNRRRCIAEINVVPYVDVMLVLLVIFMVTTPLMTQGVQVDLPSATAKEIEADKDLPVVVTVDSVGKLFLNIADNSSEEIDATSLATEVAAALSRTPGRMVLVKGDKRASYDYVVQAMVLLQQAGVPNIGLETSGVGLSK